MSTSQRSRRATRLWCLCASMLVLSACGSAQDPTDGDPATWELVAPAEVSAESTSLDIEITRLACASGRTGEVLEPVVAYEAERIVIQADVAPLAAGGYNCPGNDAVPVSVELEEPVGERELVDGACLEGEAVSTSACEDAVRRPSA